MNSLSTPKTSLPWSQVLISSIRPEIFCLLNRSSWPQFWTEIVIKKSVELNFILFSPPTLRSRTMLFIKSLRRILLKVFCILQNVKASKKHFWRYFCLNLWRNLVYAEKVTKICMDYISMYNNQSFRTLSVSTQINISFQDFVTLFYTLLCCSRNSL